MTKAELGVLCLQTREHKGLPVGTSSQERPRAGLPFKKKQVFSSLQKRSQPTNPWIWTSILRTVRE
jgi:hypothetical protein